MNAEYIVSEAHFVPGVSNPTVPRVDLLIVGASWDSRCRAIIESDYEDPPQNVLIINFKDKGISGTVEKNEAYLFDSSRRWGVGRTRVCHVDSSALDLMWTEIRAHVDAVYEHVGKPLSVVVDLTAVPRYAGLGLLGYGHKTGKIARYYAWYVAAGGYSGDTLTATPRFTGGLWHPVSVPSLGVGANASSRLHLCVSAGFEGNNTRRLVDALEPDRLSIAFSRGIASDHDSYALSQNQLIATDYMVQSSEFAWLEASDIRASVDELAKLRGLKVHGDAYKAPEAFTYLLTGSKPASLAMAIDALDGEVADLLYASPQVRYESGAVKIEWISLVELAL